MSRGLKILTVALGVVTVLCIGVVAALATTMVQGGLVTVEVVDRQLGGDDIHLTIPAGLLYAGMALAPAVAEEEIDQVRRELDEVGPGLAALFRSLEDCPDAVLLEARTPTEHVRIEKRGGKFEIRVVDQESNVRITLPARLMSRMAAAVS